MGETGGVGTDTKYNTWSTKPTFEMRLERYTQYLHGVARKWAGDHPFINEEDLFQEFSLTLWRCHKANEEQPVENFHAFFLQSLQNKIASQYRVKAIAGDREMIRMDAPPPDRNFKGGKNADPYPVVRNEESEDFYRAGIFELIESLRPETAKVVMEALDKNIRKSGLASGRRAAYLEVKNALQGNT